MDYLTRRSVACLGSVGSWIGPGRYPYLGAIGVRVSDETVARAEIEQAACDLKLPLRLPEAPRIPVNALEADLAALGLAPEELHARAKAFLRGLADEAKETGSPPCLT